MLRTEVEEVIARTKMWETITEILKEGLALLREEVKRKRDYPK